MKIFLKKILRNQETLVYKFAHSFSKPSSRLETIRPATVDVNLYDSNSQGASVSKNSLQLKITQPANGHNFHLYQNRLPFFISATEFSSLTKTDCPIFLIQTFLLSKNVWAKSLVSLVSRLSSLSASFSRLACGFGVMGIAYHR